MYYYEVLVSSPRYHKATALTYSYPEKLTEGLVVAVPLQRQTVLGAIYKKTARPSFQTKELALIAGDPTVPPELIQLIFWLANYYPAPLGNLMMLLLPSVLLQASRQTKSQFTPEKSKAAKPLPPLTAEQKAAVKIARATKAGLVLLHGDTGTGKTRVYQELVKGALAKGKSAIVLTPEIGLTSQLVQSFTETFPGQVYLLHSNLKPAQRRETWLAIARADKPVIVIGPRSALFSPVKNIGIIVVDEAHDGAYKQEQAPYYQAGRVAGQLARLHQALLIMGSATPAIQDYYVAEAKNLPIARMAAPATQTTVAKRVIEVIDLRNKNNIGRSPYISSRLSEALQQTLERKEQALIFLNRRGTARLVLCSQCGWQADCPKCDVPLTYHADNHSFQCHTCGFHSAALSSCPVCHNTDIAFKTVGTKAIVELLEKQFKDAKVMRFDTDSKKHERIEQNYAALLSGDVDILVGTQMVGKGLDLPKLGLVGIIAADASLYFPDYTSEERTYQLLYQVIGRIGRGHVPGTAIIQTYTPDNPTLQAVVNRDWDVFYKQQLEERRLFMFPPFCYLLKLSCARATSAAAKKSAEKLLADLSAHDLRVSIIGPSPSFYQKAGGKYRWQLIVKAKDRSQLLKIIPLLPSGWNYDLDPINLL